MCQVHTELCYQKNCYHLTKSFSAKRQRTLSPTKHWTHTKKKKNHTQQKQTYKALYFPPTRKSNSKQETAPQRVQYWNPIKPQPSPTGGDWMFRCQHTCLGRTGVKYSNSLSLRHLQTLARGFWKVSSDQKKKQNYRFISIIHRYLKSPIDTKPQRKKSRKCESKFFDHPPPFEEQGGGKEGLRLGEWGEGVGAPLLPSRTFPVNRGGGGERRARGSARSPPTNFAARTRWKVGRAGAKGWEKLASGRPPSSPQQTRGGEQPLEVGQV